MAWVEGKGWGKRSCGTRKGKDKDGVLKAERVLFRLTLDPIFEPHDFEPGRISIESGLVCSAAYGGVIMHWSVDRRVTF